MEKVKIISMVNHRIGVTIPDIHFKRVWPTKGYSVAVDREILDELIYNAGFKYMIDSGMLYIEDMKVKQELGLEPEDATEPVNIIVLSDKEMRTYMTTLSLVAFKEKFAKLSYEQMNAVADFAIANKLMDYDKCKFIKDTCGRDIITAIKLKEDSKEA